MCIRDRNHTLEAFRRTSSLAIQSHTSASRASIPAWLARKHCDTLGEGGHRWECRSECTCCRGRIGGQGCIQSWPVAKTDEPPSQPANIFFAIINYNHQNFRDSSFYSCEWLTHKYVYPRAFWPVEKNPYFVAGAPYFKDWLGSECALCNNQCAISNVQ